MIQHHWNVIINKFHHPRSFSILSTSLPLSHYHTLYLLYYFSFPTPTLPCPFSTSSHLTPPPFHLPYLPLPLAPPFSSPTTPSLSLFFPFSYSPFVPLPLLLLSLCPSSSLSTTLPLSLFHSLSCF